MRLRRRSFRSPFLAGTCSGLTALLLQVVGGCGQTVEVGFDDALSTTAGNGGAVGSAGASAGQTASGGAGDTGSAGAPPCVVTECRGKLYECGNCDDDDLDGRVDGADPDCLGPCDDDEGALSTGLANMAGAACRQDCYFDGDNGAGNDKCAWDHACDPLSLAPSFPPSGDARCDFQAAQEKMATACAGFQAEQEPTCLEACLPLVPNGCDCFGCCELPGGSNNFRFIGDGRGSEGCRLDAIDDETCPPCTQVKSCVNECEPCEVCVGRLPESGCEIDSACPQGKAACTTDAPCDFGEYCVTGCCVRAPEPR